MLFGSYLISDKSTVFQCRKPKNLPTLVTSTTQDPVQYIYFRGHSNERYNETVWAHLKSVRENYRKISTLSRDDYWIELTGNGITVQKLSKRMEKKLDTCHPVIPFGEVVTSVTSLNV